MPTTRTPQLATVGVIARELHVVVHRVAYIVRTRAHIQPTARAGQYWLYDRQAKIQIQDELDAIDSRRGRQENAMT